MSDRHADIRVKAVPGASRDEVAGMVGERVKVRVSAPAEGGRANRAICECIARAVGVRVRDVQIVSGHASAEKVVRIEGIGEAEARRRLGVGGG